MNPTAGHGNGLRLLPSIEAALTRHGLDYDLVRTGHPGHAVELTAQAIWDGVELIVAAGGDGTLNEVVNGLMQSKLSGGHPPTFGVLCAGRGNDFAGSIGIPEDIDSACKLLKLGQSRLLDVGRVTGGSILKGITLLIAWAWALMQLPPSRWPIPRWGGFLSFLIAILKTIFLYNHAPLPPSSTATKSLNNVL